MWIRQSPVIIYYNYNKYMNSHYNTVNPGVKDAGRGLSGVSPPNPLKGTDPYQKRDSVGKYLLNIIQ